MVKVVQHNCRKTYVTTIAAIKNGLEREAEIIYLQEPYIGKRDVTHPAYQIRWPNCPRDEIRVAIAIHIDCLNSYIFEERTDLITNSYIQVFDIWDIKDGKKIRATRLINIYDQWIGEPGSRTRPIRQAPWPSLITSRIVLLGDFNAISRLWSIYGNEANQKDLEDLISSYNLIVANNSEPTRILHNQKSTIDLTLVTPQLVLEEWFIDKENATTSDHELIVFSWADLLDPNKYDKKQTGWDISSLLECQEEAREFWLKSRPRDLYLDTAEMVEKEANNLQELITRLLNEYARPMYHCPRSKKWWTPEIKKKRTEYNSIRRKYQRHLVTHEQYKEARNSLYKLIRKTKRITWQNFLEGINEEDSNDNRGWIALRYTKPRDPSYTPMISYLDNGDMKLATTWEEKELVFRNQAFPRQPEEDIPIVDGDYNSYIDLATEEEIQYSLFTQSTKKTPGKSLINFTILRLIWEWDSSYIVHIIQACIKLGYQPICWKTAKGILLRKQGKDRGLAKSYRVISLLECLGKVMEKVVATKLANYSEHFLYPTQFGSRKHRSTLDALFHLIDYTERAWKGKDLAAALFMDVKGAFVLHAWSTEVLYLLSFRSQGQDCNALSFDTSLPLLLQHGMLSFPATGKCPHHCRLLLCKRCYLSL